MVQTSHSWEVGSGSAPPHRADCGRNLHLLLFAPLSVLVACLIAVTKRDKDTLRKGEFILGHGLRVVYRDRESGHSAFADRKQRDGR